LLARCDGERRMEMNDVQWGRRLDQPVSFAESFVHSDAFKTLFREGMDLVETTAAYLDGEGREQAKALPRMVALSYASESMRLTTRLMQLASWLLLQRAVAEGELSVPEANAQKDKVRLSNQAPINGPEGTDELPEQLRALVAQSLRLQTRIIHLDHIMAGKAEAAPMLPNAVVMQHRLLESAFSA
jgi:regulator of CtrA degradation